MKVRLFFLATSFLATPFFTSADTSVNVTGQVIASPCVVDTGTVSQLINLGEYMKQNLNNAGDGGEWSDFSLLVKNCPIGTRSVTAKLTGAFDTQDPTAWKNSGTSRNIALRVTSRDHMTIYGVNSTMQINIDNTKHNAIFLLSAKIFTPQGNASAGTFKSVMNVDFTYQ